jgi:hypothetical protein
MNMLARALRMGGNPMGNLRRALVAKSGEWKGVDVPLLQVSLAHQELDVPNLEVSGTDQGGKVPVPSVSSSPPKEVFGFVFGSALTARCLELHEQRFGGGYLGLVRFLGAVGTGAVFGTQFWKEQHPWLLGSSTPLVADGRPIPYLAAVGATVDVQLFGGWVTGLRSGRGQAGRFPLRVLQKMSPGAVARRLPDLLLGRKAAGIEDLEAVQSVRARRRLQPGRRGLPTSRTSGAASHLEPSLEPQIPRPDAMKTVCRTTPAEPGVLALRLPPRVLNPFFVNWSPAHGFGGGKPSSPSRQESSVQANARGKRPAHGAV